MICTQCAAPALTFSFSDAHLVRCAECAFCWMADDNVTRLRECFDAKTLRVFEATVCSLKRKARGAGTAVLIGLVEKLGRAEDLVIDQEEKRLADSVRPARRRRAVATEPPEPAFPDTAAMLAATLAKRKS